MENMCHGTLRMASVFILILCMNGELSAKKRVKKSPLDNVVNSEVLINSNVGISIINCTDGAQVYRHNSEKLFIPASVLKILTAYTSLKVLTPQYQFVTSYYVDTIGVEKKQKTNLYIKGSGDPTLTSADLEKHARALQEVLGGDSVSLIIDNSFFDTLHLGKGWMWDDPNIPVASFFIDHNVLKIHVYPGDSVGSALKVKTEPWLSFYTLAIDARTGMEDKISIRHANDSVQNTLFVEGTFGLSSTPKPYFYIIDKPEQYAANVLAVMLRQQDVNVGRSINAGVVPDSAALIYSFKSPVLGDIIRKFLKESNNLYGECLLKTLGAVVHCPPGDASRGTAVIRRTLQNCGIDSTKYRVVDGSGLSTYNLVSPDIVTTVLKSAYDDFSLFPEFSSALSVSGADGTLKERMNDSLLVREVRAKSGSLSGVSSLAGYVKTKKGNVMAFTLIVNGFVGSQKTIRCAIDDIVRVVREEY